MSCTLCSKPILLVPSAAARAHKYGGKASDYTKLFTEHAGCALSNRKQTTLELVRRRNEAGVAV